MDTQFTQFTQFDDSYSELDDIDRNIIKLKLEKPGISGADIARIIGGSKERVNKRLQKEKVQDVLKQATKPAIDILLEAQPKAARRLIKELNSEDSNIAIKAAREILKGVLSENIKIGNIEPLEQKLSDFMDKEDLENLIKELKKEENE
jgi:DNA-binding Lrp family transcriptional regulator